MNFDTLISNLDRGITIQQEEPVRGFTGEKAAVFDDRIDTVSAAANAARYFRPQHFDTQSYINNLAQPDSAPINYAQTAAQHTSQAPRPINLGNLAAREDPDGEFREGFDRNILWDGRLAADDPANVARELAAQADLEARKQLDGLPKATSIFSRLVSPGSDTTSPTIPQEVTMTGPSKHDVYVGNIFDRDDQPDHPVAPEYPMNRPAVDLAAYSSDPDRDLRIQQARDNLAQQMEAA